jgi:dTDP-6-deoxy-L-talose 4-dehydrogenase (NAD+)
LTGATGFVGRHVLRHLRRRRVPVRVVVRRGSEHRLEGLEGLEGAEGLERVIVTDDLFAEDAAWWRACCADVDTVLHAAWFAEPGRYLQAPENLACLQGTLQLARGAADAGLRRFVGVGTCFEYDLAQGTPPGHFSVNTPLRPTTTYAACKASAFLTLSSWLKTKSIEFLWCRLFYLYGEGEDARRLVPYLRARLSAGEAAELTSGTQVRDFLDVDVAASLLVDAAIGSAQGARNVCSGEGITVRALAEQIADDYGRRDLLRFGARPDNLVDPPCVVGVVEAR